MLLLALGVGLAASEAGSAQGGAAATLFLAVLCMLGGLPWLFVLGGLVVWMRRAPRATRRGLRRAATFTLRLETTARRWADRAVRPVVQAAEMAARLQAVPRALSPSQGKDER